MVTFNEYDRSTHTLGALASEIENTIKEKSLEYVNEYTIQIVDLIYKEGETSYKESAKQLTYHNTNIVNIKSIAAEVQSVYSWMNISY